jgi:hypothetical protein
MLSSSELLALWDRCVPLPSPAGRARELVRAVDKSARPLTVGQGNVELLGLYVALAGPMLAGVADCPSCGAELDVELDARLLTAADTDPGVGEVVVDVDGRRAVVAVPSFDHLADGPADGDALMRCLVADAGSAPPAAWSDADRDTVEEALAEADPMAEISVALACPDCGRAWTETLDPAAFVWAEVDAEVRRMATDVLELTRAYGWSEAEITGMSPWRRRLYLEAAGA